MKRVSFVIISGFTIYFIIASCGKKSNTMEPTFNKPPEASFTVQPSTGFTDTDFQFDASSCSDADDNIDSLKIRWDWENDGTWDTSYLTEKIISHRYDTEGIKTVKMEVQDVEGLTDTDEQQVTVSNTVIDIDGNTYQAIKIGDQWWMAENLKVTHYRNGDPIPNVTDSTEWSNLATEAYCVYENDESIAETYGYLYNWYVVNDSRNIAPEGWHVPTDEEWKELEMFLGMSQSEANGTGWRGTDEGGKLKETGITHWNSPNSGATNESGFTALPGGVRSIYGNFNSLGDRAIFWSSSEDNTYAAWDRMLYYSNSDLARYGGSKQGGLSVRLVRDY